MLAAEKQPAFGALDAMWVPQLQSQVSAGIFCSYQPQTETVAPRHNTMSSEESEGSLPSAQGGETSDRYQSPGFIDPRVHALG